MSDINIDLTQHDDEPDKTGYVETSHELVSRFQSQLPPRPVAVDNENVETDDECDQRSAASKQRRTQELNIAKQSRTKENSLE